MYYPDSLEDAGAQTTPRTTRLDAMQISNSLGDDLGGMTFFEPDSETKYLIYPADREEYPNYSILRWAGFASYSDSALAALRALLARVDARLGAGVGLHGMLSSTEQLVEHFAELYDLDIKRHVYRKEYQRLKTITGIESDYEQLQQKVESLTQAASLREQQLVNKVLIILTAGILWITGVAVVATVAKWHLLESLLWAGAGVLASIAIGASGVNAMRRLASRWRR
jgi:hypothetical protein